MQAVILAGGKGTRLQSVVSDVPKPMAPVNERPFLEYIMQHLVKAGMRQVIMSVGYKYQCIVDYFQDEYRGMAVEYSIEEKPLGTGGAIKAALKKCTGDRVFVLNGDTFFDVDYHSMYRFSEETDAPLVMAVKEMQDFDRYGCVEVAEEKIVGFREKKFCKNGFVNGGVYCISRNLLDDVESNVFSFEKDFLEKCCGELRVPVFPSQGYFIDIGVPEEYLKAIEHFR